MKTFKTFHFEYIPLVGVRMKLFSLLVSFSFGIDLISLKGNCSILLQFSFGSCLTVSSSRFNLAVMGSSCLTMVGCSVWLFFKADRRVHGPFIFVLSVWPFRFELEATLAELLVPTLLAEINSGFDATVAIVCLLWFELVDEVKEEEAVNEQISLAGICFSWYFCCILRIKRSHSFIKCIVYCKN